VTDRPFCDTAGYSSREPLPSVSCYEDSVTEPGTLWVVDTRTQHLILPTTGVFVGDWYYYIANPQAYSINSDETLFPPEQLKDVVILKTELK